MKFYSVRLAQRTKGYSPYISFVLTFPDCNLTDIHRVAKVFLLGDFIIEEISFAEYFDLPLRVFYTFRIGAVKLEVGSRACIQLRKIFTKRALSSLVLFYQV